MSAAEPSDEPGSRAPPTCPICDGSDVVECPVETDHLRIPRGRSVRRCCACTHAFLHPPYARAETAATYSDEYYDRFEATVGMAGDGPAGAADHLNERLALIGARVAGRRLLDVGCGRGSFLAHAASQGWTVRGIDVSADAVETVRTARGLTADRGEVDQFEFPTASFDLIHAHHVIEHVRDPLDALRRFRRWLASGGLLALEVPNEFENLFFALGRLVLPRDRLRRRDPSPHVQFFTPASLRAALRRAAFEPLELRTVRWQVGVGSSRLVRSAKRVVAAAERMLDRGGNIVAIARPA